MKTHRHLYARIVDFDNLHRAFKNAARGKRGHADVAAFEFNLEENLVQLQDELVAQTYRPGAYHNFWIYDPKPRLISAVPFRDRVVHHALCQIIEPLFERRFIFDSYANRKGKGTHAALDRAQLFARRYPYVLQMDLEHFFPTMDHTILRAQLARVIADSQTLALAGLILDSGAGIHAEPPRYFPDDDLFAGLRARGLPIGNLTSQFWANVYLNPLDHFIKRALKCHGYVRYVDDLLLFGADKAALHAYRRAIIDFAATLRQKFHEERAAVFPTGTGIPFLGWRVYPDHRRLKRRNGIKFQRRFARLIKEYVSGQITLERLSASVNGWIAHVVHGDTWGLRCALFRKPIFSTVASSPDTTRLG